MGLHLFVSPEAKARLDEYVSASGAPQWAIVEAAIMSPKPDATGVPAEWNLTPPADLLPGMEAQRKTA